MSELDLCPPETAAVFEHWTEHAVERFLERYGHCGIKTDDFFGIVPRVEQRWRQMFDNLPSHMKGPVLVSVRLWAHETDELVKVRLIYDTNSRTVVTVLPPKLDNRDRGRIVRISL